MTAGAERTEYKEEAAVDVPVTSPLHTPPRPPPPEKPFTDRRDVKLQTTTENRTDVCSHSKAGSFAPQILIYTVNTNTRTKERKYL